ncbi:hypothetical protein [Flavobacterium sp.]|uniref:hypothetical protein n=1 Tax=Flavobacterium sp. TaxID=239 RepID=UPI004048614E
MSKPLFFYHQNKFYNIKQIVKFETISVTHHITFSTGELLKVNTGHLDFKKIISVINPPYGEEYSQS